MAISVLTAKLHMPQLSDNVISKAKLLNDCSWANVILVSAQAGSGKSTVVSDWLSEQERPFIWYSLDEWDNDITQFFAYLTMGIKSIDKQAAEVLEQLLDAFQSVGFESFIRVLVHQLHAIEHPFILVLDDYHVIQNDQVHQVLRTILEHFPQLMQLVLITREDPPLPLAKLRASKRLLELRISDLRFTEKEAEAFFMQQLNLNLQEEQLRHLFERTEGWIAGLQLTALSMQGLDDIDVFIKAFAASHYYIMDYLMEEVLERHPPEIKEFLLATSMLEFFSGELCEDLLQLEAGAGNTIIERLVKTNSFIISTDSSQQWYRYHHLFRDLLRQRLDIQSKKELEQLHLRAGLWFKKNEREQEAIHHLLKANAFEEAAALIECKWSEMDVQLQSASWLDMAKSLPVSIIERSPVLAMGYGWALLDMGDVDVCIAWFNKAQDLYNRCQEDMCPEDIIITDTIQFNLLPATISSAYGYIAASTGDIEGIFLHARDALMLIPGDQYYKRGVVSMLLGIAHWQMGDLHEAEEVIAEALKSIRGNVNPFVENSFHMVLGELYIQQGDLSKAKMQFEQTISRAIEQNCVPIILASLYLGLAKIAFLQNENRDAYALLEESKTHGQRYSLMDWKYKYKLLLARVYCAEGLYDLARDCIKEGKANYFINPLPDEITLEDMETMIDNADTPHRQYPISEAETLKKLGGTKKELANQSLAEPLTVRELEVLALIASGLSNQEICDTLFLALSTVKGYNQTIFGKLQVKRRTEAVVKAKALDIV